MKNREQTEGAAENWTRQDIRSPCADILAVVNIPTTISKDLRLSIHLHPMYQYY